MKHFVNYQKRGVTLPKGCKNLSDLQKVPGQAIQFPEAIRALIQKAKCEYCGSPALGGSISYSSGSPAEETHFWCEQCQHDLCEFDRDPENSLADEIDIEDEAARERAAHLLERIDQRRELFMRRKVAARKDLT